MNNWNPPFDEAQLNIKLSSYEIIEYGVPVCPIERAVDEYEWRQNVTRIVNQNMIGNVNYTVST